MGKRTKSPSSQRKPNNEKSPGVSKSAKRRQNKQKAKREAIQAKNGKGNRNSENRNDNSERIEKKEGGRKPQSTLSRLQAKLLGAQFRFLNESLYTHTGEESTKTFQEQPELFEVYHEGFREQVQKWPVNPLDLIMKKIEKDFPKSAKIADFGCGDARLHETLNPRGYTVHSFDLISRKPYVTACNLSHIPLGDSSVDVGVFCLALMGTDWPKFVAEAWRCLRPNGTLYIAEVSSRLPSPTNPKKPANPNSPNPKAAGNPKSQMLFAQAISKCGFEIVDVDAKFSTHFVMLKARKKGGEREREGEGEREREGPKKGKKETPGGRKTAERIDVEEIAKMCELKPCLYKKR